LLDLVEPWDVRALSIRKAADLPLQLCVGTFPRFVAIGFYFLSETLYKSKRPCKSGKWAENWGMRFNATKCYIMSIKKKTHKFNQLGGHILEQVDSNPYLELQISEDLEWSTHISKITKKANTTIGHPSSLDI
jgi:hypothetical protein